MNEKSTGGIGFVGWLTLLFIALKLTGFIEWSWFWVLSPLWITFIVLFILILLVQVLKKDY
jgi:fatty acid desaturase